MKSELTTLLYSNGRWEKADKILIPPGSTRIGEIWRFYANVICYGRVALTLVAAVTLMEHLPRTTAALILISTLLDWVDGPVARRLNQSTIFGCGVDWLADVLCQVITLIWWAQLDLRFLPVVFAFTAVETALSIFDFASSVTGIYPSYRGLVSRIYGNPFFSFWIGAGRSAGPIPISGPFSGWRIPCSRWRPACGSRFRVMLPGLVRFSGRCWSRPFFTCGARRPIWSSCCATGGSCRAKPLLELTR